MASLDAETVHRLEGFFGDWLTDANAPGASIAVVRDGDHVDLSYDRNRLHKVA